MEERHFVEGSVAQVDLPGSHHLLDSRTERFQAKGEVGQGRALARDPDPGAPIPPSSVEALQPCGQRAGPAPERIMLRLDIRQAGHLCRSLPYFGPGSCRASRGNEGDGRDQRSGYREQHQPRFHDLGQPDRGGVVSIRGRAHSRPSLSSSETSPRFASSSARLTWPASMVVNESCPGEAPRRREWISATAWRTARRTSGSCGCRSLASCSAETTETEPSLPRPSAAAATRGGDSIARTATSGASELGSAIAAIALAAARARTLES